MRMSSPSVAMASARRGAGVARWVVATLMAGSSNMTFATMAPPTQPAICVANLSRRPRAPSPRRISRVRRDHLELVAGAVQSGGEADHLRLTFRVGATGLERAAASLPKVVYDHQ